MTSELLLVANKVELQVFLRQSPHEGLLFDRQAGVGWEGVMVWVTVWEDWFCCH